MRDLYPFFLLLSSPQQNSQNQRRGNDINKTKANWMWKDTQFSWERVKTVMLRNESQ